MDLEKFKNENNDTCAIIVTYNPIVSRVKKLINSLEEQNCDYFVIDNSPNKIDDLTTERYKWLGGNKGIAQAQNEGIQWALEAKYPYIIFFDQDSDIQKEFVPTLLSAMKKKILKYVHLFSLMKNMGLNMLLQMLTHKVIGKKYSPIVKQIFSLHRL